MDSFLDVAWHSGCEHFIMLKEPFVGAVPNLEGVWLAPVFSFGLFFFLALLPNKKKANLLTLYHD